VDRLEDKYRSELGSILVRLLPAGSVSGAPKTRTLEIHPANRTGKRGYYTECLASLTGKTLKRCNDPFYERKGSKYFYRSGGGITTQSNGESEYQEAIDKVYVPAN
jgi:para-aminobenzoate synthetase component 1